MDNRLYSLFCEHPHVSTDTRHIEPDSIFFALRGTSFDGNRFAADALAQGAVCAVVDDPVVAATDSRMLLVDDTLQALQDLAREHRRALGIPIIAIAGSNGKTTTKELVSRVLAERYTVYATRGNLNNHIGVPLTLLSMTSEIQLGVVEMGASACGEIARLTAIAEPDYGLLTNIGRCHLEGFGGPEGVRRGKGELFDFLDDTGGWAFVRADDPVLTEMAAEHPRLHAEHYDTSIADGFESRLEGDYNRFNIAAAVVVGRRFGVPEENIRHAIANYAPDNNRSQRIETQCNTLIVDCYNANPSSMRASIENFQKIPLGSRSQRVLILGDMLELGEWSQQEHTEIIRLALSAEDVHIHLVGNEFARAYATMAESTQQGDTRHPKSEPQQKITLYPSRAELIKALSNAPLSNTLILIKGSHSIGLEQSIENL